MTSSDLVINGLVIARLACVENRRMLVGLFMLFKLYDFVRTTLVSLIYTMCKLLLSIIMLTP